eukprot:TRINITY_DN30182_c0_g2_i1.p1 TRINITY_DN30182_c0_g2~~TRINITY_DN30182_c0_g2_i1.p1  ORF type:complete len:356 (+),score=50.24 TRINITY_DN30182_c0_g2_i1:71-1138(+)
MEILPWLLMLIFAALPQVQSGKAATGNMLIQAKASFVMQPWRNSEPQVLASSTVVQASFHSALAEYLLQNSDSQSFLQLIQKTNARSNASKNPDSNMHIPCHIHQQWKTQELDTEQQQSADSWKSMNPECKYTLWTDKDIESFMRKNFHNSLWPIWKYLQPIQRADAFRYAVLLHEGGYYADIDVDCMQPIKDWPVPKDISLLLGYEHSYHLGEEERKHVVFSRSEQIQNFFLGSAPGHQVLKRCLEILRMKFRWGVEDTLELTGPATLSDAAHEFLLDKANTKPGVEPSYLQRKLDDDSSKMHFATGAALGPPGAQVLVLTADQVAGPNGFSAHPGSNIIFHHYAGTWKPEGQT